MNGGIDASEALFQKVAAEVQPGVIMSIIVAFLLASVAAGQEQPVAAAPAEASAPAKPVKEKKICKADPEADSGSHMVRRICHTQSEWDNQRGMSESSRSGVSMSGEAMQQRH